MTTRTVVKHIRLTEDEAEQLTREANEQYKSLSAYVRYRLFETDRPHVPVEILKQLKKLMYYNQKIGNNINQVAHICNANKEVSRIDYEKLLEHQAALEEKTAQIFDLLKRVYL